MHDPAAAAVMARAVHERRDAARVRVVVQDGGFVSGEVRAVIRGLDGGPAVPPGRRVLPHEHGVGGAPTFASNVETFAQLALLSSLGADRFAEIGSPDEPGTTLLTLVGDVPHAGVVEVPTGLPLAALLRDQDTQPRPVLVGGYHGSWVSDIQDLVVSRPSLRAAGTPLNAGVIARLSQETCTLPEVVAVSSWLAEQSSGPVRPVLLRPPRRGPRPSRPAPGRRPGADLVRRVGQLPGRGACAHPDGSATFVRTALAVLAEEIDLHRRRGSCGRPWRQELPTAAPTVERSTR